MKGIDIVEPQDPKNPYSYNGKEYQEDLGLSYYGFRMYDPAIARFTGVDPISDRFAWVSSYNYAENSPIANIDLHGLQAVPHYEELASDVTVVGILYESFQNVRASSFNMIARGKENFFGYDSNGMTTRMRVNYDEHGYIIPIPF